MLLGANLHVRQRFGVRFLIFSEWHGYIERETKRNRHRHRKTKTEMTDTLPSFFKVQESQPKTKTRHSRNCIFFKTLFINYCRSSRSLSKCKCSSSIYTNVMIPKLPFQILTTASALLQLSIIYMSSTSLKPFSLKSTLFCKPTIYYCDPARSFRLQQKTSDLLWTLSTVFWALVNSPTSRRDHHHHPRHQKISNRLLPWVHPWLISLELQTLSTPCMIHENPTI